MVDQTEALFLRTLEDLEQRITKDDAYEVLGASALLRKLLLDDSPLVDQINRKYRLKIEFEIGAPSGPPPGLPPPTLYTVQDGIDPDTAPPFVKPVRVNREQFFKTVLVIIQGRQYTLREIILFEANVMGGVHAGSPKEEKEQALRQINDTIAVGGYRTSLRQIKGVGRVVLKALAPLRQRIEQEAGAT